MERTRNMRRRTNTPWLLRNREMQPPAVAGPNGKRNLSVDFYIKVPCQVRGAHHFEWAGANQRGPWAPRRAQRIGDWQHCICAAGL